MRDEEIESLLRSVRPRGLPEPDRRRIIESILAAGNVRSPAWWERPVALWKAAAVLLFAAIVGTSWLHFTADARNAGLSEGERAASVASSIIRRTYSHVDPSVFRGGDAGLFHDGDLSTWCVLDHRVAGQSNEDSQ